MKQLIRLKLMLSLMLLGSSMGAYAMARDTTIIEFHDKGIRKRITVQTPGDKKVNLPRILNLENLLKEIGVDSNERRKATVLIENENGGKDTVFVMDRMGKSIRIIARNPFPNKVIRIDTTGKPSSPEWEGRGEDDHREVTVTQTTPPAPRKYFSSSDFGLYLGLNNWTSSGMAAPELSRWQSRYVALSFRRNATLLKSKPVDIALSVGPEVAWYNFMFENNVATYAGGQVAFGQPAEPLRKSKLVLPYINLPVLLNFGLNESKINFGVGGYVGYRLGGYTKTKDSSGNRNRVRGSYGMSDVIYGLTAEAGTRRGLTLFVRYDLSPLFKSNQIMGRDIQAWSVGVRI